MIRDNSEFLDRAMKSYTSRAITIADFENDLNSYITIKKCARRTVSDISKLRLLVNHVVIYYNIFGKTATDLLIYKIPEHDLLGVIIPIILYLGMSNTDVEKLNVSLNINIVKCLMEL